MVTLKYQMLLGKNTVWEKEKQFDDINKARQDYMKLVELKNKGKIANIEYKISGPTRRVVQVCYTPNGKVYIFETDFAVKKGQAVMVKDLSSGQNIYVAAITNDYEMSEVEIAKKFDLRKLRKLTGKVA